MATRDHEQSEETLSSMFAKGLNLHSDIEDSSEDSNSENFQLKVRKAILLLEDATRLVSALDLFSRNETVSEVPTSHLKFFLLPVLLGDLNIKIVDGTNRLELIKIVETYYIDYLTRVKDYEIVEDIRVPKISEEEPEENEKPPPRGPPNMDLMNQEREEKIRRYKEKKSLESKIQELKTAVDNPSCDEDVMREFYISLIKRFVITSLDELNSLREEKGIVKYMEKMKKSGMEPPKPQKSRPLKPIIITKDALQKKVFGLGYTNLPVMSIEEFYDERARHGWYDHQKEPNAESLMSMAMKDGEDVLCKENEEARILEEKEERDDELELARKRAMDDYKDQHKRGEGNMYNKG